MKLLFDQNLSPSLVSRLADLFPGSAHVELLGLGQADDGEIWNHALNQDFAIVTKDEDYDSMCVIRGTPPKVIWLLLGNCTTAEVEALFRDRFADIVAFESDDDAGTLAIG